MDIGGRTAVAGGFIVPGGRRWEGGTRRKPGLGGSQAPCARAQSCARGKTGRGVLPSPSDACVGPRPPDGPALPPTPPLTVGRLARGLKSVPTSGRHLPRLTARLSRSSCPSDRSRQSIWAGGAMPSRDRRAPWMAPASPLGWVYGVSRLGMASPAPAIATAQPAVSPSPSHQPSHIKKAALRRPSRGMPTQRAGIYREGIGTRPTPPYFSLISRRRSSRKP